MTDATDRGIGDPPTFTPGPERAPGEIYVEYMALGELEKAERNAKRHSLGELEGSMRRFGYTAPMMLNENTRRLLAGHGRLDTLVARKAAGHAPPDRVFDRGHDWYVPVLRGIGFADAREAEAYLLADNRLVELGGYDELVLAEMARFVATSPEGLEGTGWTTDAIEDRMRVELAGLLVGAQGAGAGADPAGAAGGDGGVDPERAGGETDEEARARREAARAALAKELDDAVAADAEPEITATEELRIKWGTALGQLWAIPSRTCPGGSNGSEHRILCGSSTEPADVARLMQGRKATILHTDPPYGVDYVAARAGMPGYDLTQFGNIANDDLKGAELQAFLDLVLRTAEPHLVDAVAIYVWYAAVRSEIFNAALRAFDCTIHRQIIWVKPQFVFSRSGMYHWQHEPCLYAWRKGRIPPWYGDKAQSSVWPAGRDNDAGMHPTQKPIGLFIRPLMNHTEPGDIAYEPFSGSGSQTLACEQVGRLCRAMELDPAYVAVLLERASQRGLEPRLVEEG